MKHVFAFFIAGASFTLISTSSSLLKNATSAKDEDEMADDSPLPTPAGLSFIGSGYDLVRGNPDGQDITNGGVDPGLLPAKRILDISYKEDKKSDNNQYLVPDQIRFTVRESCASSKKHDIVANSEAYQKQLKVSVSVEAEYEGVWSAAFSASASYENTNKATTDSEKVFYEERSVCMKGNAEYFTDMAFQGIFSVSEAFASAVCNLPPEYIEKTYTAFLKAWGTNVVVGADLGTKTILRRESSKSAFTSYALTNYAGSVSASGGYGGVSASVTVDVESLSESMKSGSNFGSKETKYEIGGENMPEPIAIRLMSIEKMFNVKLYSAYINKRNSRIPCRFSKRLLAKRSKNIKKALDVYPSTLNVRLPTGSPNVTVEITWPKGTYAIPMVNAQTRKESNEKRELKELPPLKSQDCPESKDFSWRTGGYYQDCEDDDNSNDQSPGNHLGIINGRDARQDFCVKTQETPSHLTWPKGSYCIAKKGDCPDGFDEGGIRWDDEDDDNQNKHNGVLPDGIEGKIIAVSGSNTVIDFCCRTDGFPSNPIYLPSSVPFLLYKAKDGICQQVFGMTVEEEWAKWDMEDDDNESDKAKSVPLGDIGSNIKLFYCFYKPNWWNLP